MKLSGMSLPAAYSIDLRWGDTALANFFGTSARADAADPSSSVVSSMLSEPEGIASPFVIQAFDSQSGFRINDIKMHEASAKNSVLPQQSQNGAFLLIVIVALVAFLIATKVKL